MRSVLFDVFCSFTSCQNYASPLHVASQNGHHDVVQALLGAGADVNIPGKKSQCDPARNDVACA